MFKKTADLVADGTPYYLALITYECFPDEEEFNLCLFGHCWDSIETVWTELKPSGHY